MEQVQCKIGYLVKMIHAAIRFHTEEPDFSALPDQQFDWAYTVYGNVEEFIPQDMPTPLGKFVTLTHYVDANLYHDLITGRSVTGILHLVNKTPIDWYSKKQATMETATYGSEFIATHICVDQSIDLKNTLLCYLGVPVCKKAYMFGDNKSVVDSSTVPHAKLHKQHNTLSIHQVWEAIAAAIIGFYHIEGNKNSPISSANTVCSEYSRKFYVWKRVCCYVYRNRSYCFFALQVENVWCAIGGTSKCFW